ncbi:MAG: DUF86 domain-containing protein [Deltaproteobacteria bacterium]|nr:MAG: DUF86 domain-containing protein [Deltaproteobacteria bacterium]
MPSSASCGRGSLPSRSVPARDWRLRIEDILAAVERVQRYTVGMDLSSFIVDEKTVDAVSFCFGVIGEAARHIPEDVVAANPDLPWPEMRAMRNVVVHEYFGVTQETL